MHHSQLFTLRTLFCRGDRKSVQADLPEYVSKLPSPVICSTIRAPDIIDCKTPVGYLIDMVKRPLSAALHPETVDQIFLDVEKIYVQSTLLEENNSASVLNFLESVELELAIMFAMYPRNLDALHGCNRAVTRIIADAGGLQQIEGAFATVISIPDALLHLPSSKESRETIWRLIGKRGEMKELLIKRDALFEELFYCRYANDRLRDEVLSTVLPYFDKGATIDDTIRRLHTSWSLHVLKVQSLVMGWRRALRLAGKRPRIICLFSRHLVVFKLHSQGQKEFEYYAPLDAVRITQSDAGLLSVCVPHKGMVKDYKATDQTDLTLFVNRFHDLSSVTNANVDIASKPLKKQPIHQDKKANSSDIYKAIVQWPAPVIPDAVGGTLMTLLTLLDSAKCILYKFDNNSTSWCSRGKSALRIELSESTSDPFMVIRSAENGLVRLNVSVVNAVVEFYPQSFSVYDVTDKTGKANMFQIKFADSRLLQSMRDLIEHVKLKTDESNEWRKLDRIPSNVILDISECSLTVSHSNDGHVTFNGRFRLLSNGKFEFNHESMLIGWICDCKHNENVHVVVHGAILDDHKKIRWCSMTISCYNTGTAKTLLDALTGQTTEFEGDLVNFLNSYGGVEQFSIDKGQFYEDDLCLNDIFVDNAKKECKKPARLFDFKETPAGRLIDFGIIE